MRQPRRRSEWKWILAISVLVLIARAPWRDASAQPEEGNPKTELILLFSGAVAGHLEPCG